MSDPTKIRPLSTFGRRPNNIRRALPTPITNDKALINVAAALGAYPLSPLITEMIKYILSGHGEGLILVNKQGKIEFMDHYTEAYFNLAPGQGRGLGVKQLVQETRLDIVAKTGQKEVGRILRMPGRDIIVTRFPIKKDGQVIGAFGKIVFHKLDEIQKLNNEILQLKERLQHYQKDFIRSTSAKYTFGDILGCSHQILEAKQLAIKIAGTDSSVLILGESGTGKELFAQSIHNASHRKNKPFIPINCAAIPLELAESELFGYEKGAFSGAKTQGKAGKFELCNGGTIFLDDVDSLSLNIQAKLLRVLQERETERVGGESRKKVDFRLISASNENLISLIERGLFRADLYYRLDHVQLVIPPLRQRPKDIPIYIDHYLKQINASFGMNIKGLSSEALNIFMNHNWPGNVRELVNLLRKCAFLTIRGQVILADNVPSFVSRKLDTRDKEPFALKKAVQELEKDHIKNVLKLTKGNKARASRLLEIPRSMLYEKMRKYKI